MWLSCQKIDFCKYLNCVVMGCYSASCLRSWYITTAKASFVHRRLVEAIQRCHVLLSLHDPVLITMATLLEFCGGHVRRSSCKNDHSTFKIIREVSEADRFEFEMFYCSGGFQLACLGSHF